MAGIHTRYAQWHGANIYTRYAARQAYVAPTCIWDPPEQGEIWLSGLDAALSRAWLSRLHVPGPQSAQQISGGSEPSGRGSGAFGVSSGAPL